MILAWRRGAILSALALCAGGCRTLQSAVAPGSSGYASGLTEPELRDKLSAFYTHFTNAIQMATTRAAHQTSDPTVRMRLTLAKLRTTRACRSVVFQRQTMTAFLDTWAICVQLQAVLVGPEAEATFGETLPLLSQTTVLLRNEIAEVGKLFLKPDQFEDVQRRLEEYARKNPLALSRESLPKVEFSKESRQQLGWLLELPLSPFRALQGVDQTALAVRELAFVADRFSRTSEDLARELTWETELLLMGIRREVAGVLDDLDRRQQGLQGTLKQAQPITEAAERTARAVADAGAAWDGALKTYTRMVKELYPPNPEAAAKEPGGPPFDIREYARTAENLTAAAAELQRLLVEVQKTAGAGAVSERLKEAQETAQAAVASTEASASRLTDHITKRAIQGIGVFFLALLVYRVISLALRRRMPPGA